MKSRRRVGAVERRGLAVSTLLASAAISWPVSTMEWIMRTPRPSQGMVAPLSWVAVRASAWGSGVAVAVTVTVGLPLRPLRAA